VKLVRWLADQGAAVNTRADTGHAALHLASEQGRTPVVKIGADPSLTGYSARTPLIDACSWGHVETVRCLLDHPRGAATIDQRCGRGMTALWWVGHKRRVDLLRLLLERGADPTIADNYGRTRLVRAQQQHDLECIEVKVEGEMLCFVRRLLTGLTEL
jgi:uncharacterized protein